MIRFSSNDNKFSSNDCNSYQEDFILYDEYYDYIYQLENLEELKERNEYY